MIGCVVGFGIDGQVRSLERGQIETRDYLRIAQSEWAAGRDVNLTEDAHVLIRWHRIPVYPRPA